MNTQSNLQQVSDLVEVIGSMEPSEIRQTILDIEAKMLTRPDAVVGDACPLYHSFAEGLYVREIVMPPGFISTTKIHKNSHPAFILEGEVLVIEEGGATIVKGPTYFITKTGTKRIVVCKTQVVWVTVHHTHSTDLKDIEEEIISKSFSDMEETS